MVVRVGSVVNQKNKGQLLSCVPFSKYRDRLFLLTSYIFMFCECAFLNLLLDNSESD